MSDEQQIVIANNGGGVINVLIIGSNPIVISDPNITAPGEVLPPGDNVDNSTIISPNKAIDVNEKKQVNLSSSPSPIESLVTSILAFGLILTLLICFWPYILSGGLLLLIVRIVWLWLKDQFS